eukprot:1932438-Amphidinium_carterae.1
MTPTLSAIIELYSAVFSLRASILSDRLKAANHQPGTYSEYSETSQKVLYACQLETTRCPLASKNAQAQRTKLVLLFVLHAVPNPARTDGRCILPHADTTMWSCGCCIC